jgi:hypothetical protein
MRALERFLSFSAVTAAFGFAAVFASGVQLSGCAEDPVPGIVFSKCTVDGQCRGGMTCKACGCYPADQECPVPDAGGDGSADGGADGPTDGSADGSVDAADGTTDTVGDTGVDTGVDSGTDTRPEGGLDAADAPGDG